jgi:hypothetical protein
MCNFIFTKEQFIQSQQAWKSNDAKHSAMEHIAYNIVRGKPADRGFISIQRPNKIESNSCDKWNGFNQPLRSLKGLFTNTSVWQAERIANRIKELEKALGITITDEFKMAILETKENRE